MIYWRSLGTHNRGTYLLPQYQPLEAKQITVEESQSTSTNFIFHQQ